MLDIHAEAVRAQVGCHSIEVAHGDLLVGFERFLDQLGIVDAAAHRRFHGRRDLFDGNRGLDERQARAELVGQGAHVGQDLLGRRRAIESDDDSLIHDGSLPRRSRSGA